MQRHPRPARPARPDRFRSWLIAIAHRQVQLYLRDRQQGPAAAAGDPAGAAGRGRRLRRADASPSPADGQRRELAEAARWLDDDDRRLLALWWREIGRRAHPRRTGRGRSTFTPEAGRDAGAADEGAARGGPGGGPGAAGRAALPRAGRTSCTAGTAMPNPVWRKRLVRHVRDCPQCGRHGAGWSRRSSCCSASLPCRCAGLDGPDAAGVRVHPVWAVRSRTPANKIVAGAAAVRSRPAAASRTPSTRRPPARPARGDRPAAGRRAASAPSVRAAPSHATRRPGAAPAAAARRGDRRDGGRHLRRPGRLRHRHRQAASPFATLAKAVAVVRPGQTIALRGGTYRPTGPVVITTSGTASKRITLSNYRDERPVIDASAVPADKSAIIHRGRLLDRARAWRSKTRAATRTSAAPAGTTSSSGCPSTTTRAPR